MNLPLGLRVGRSHNFPVHVATEHSHRIYEAAQAASRVQHVTSDLRASKTNRKGEKDEESAK
jgi:hypothetical protein